MGRYELQLTLRVVNVGEDGRHYGNEGLQVDDRLTLNADGFMEIAGILGRFHELAEALRAERAGDE